MSELHPALCLKLEGHCLIEASAGTGKTWSIAKLFVRALLEKNLTPKQVLVVTFTNAATKELSERLYLELLDVENWLQQCVQSQAIAQHDFYADWAHGLSESAFDAKKSLLWLKRCLYSFDEAAISTLQGFCEGLVKRHATEMGLELAVSAFNSGEVVGAVEPSHSSNGVALEVSKIYLDQIAMMNALPIRQAGFLKAAIGNYSDLLSAVQALLNKPAALPKRSATSLKVQANELLSCGVLEASEVLAQAVNGANIDAFIAYGNRYMAQAKRNKSISSRQFNDLVLALEELAQTGVIDRKDADRLKRVNDKSQIGKSSVSSLSGVELAADLDVVKAVQTYFEHYSAFERKADEYRQQVILTALGAARQALLNPDNLTFANTPLSYTRTMQLAAQGLQRYPAVAVQFRERFPIALIDEFQDTDPTQAIILNAIYPPLADQSSSFGVVMVGDPKQAIYNFRGADVYAYLNAKQSVQQLFSLDTNQRSVAPLVAEVNAVFLAIPEVFDVEGIDFVAMRPSGKHIAKFAAPALRYVVMPESKAGFDVWAWVADEIVSTLDANPELKPQDIAVLVSNHKHAHSMQTALALIGLASRLNEKGSIWQHPMASYLLWFLQGIYNFTNPPALKKALLTPLGSMMCERLFSQEALNDLTLIRAVNDTLLAKCSELKNTWMAEGFASFWQAAFPFPATDLNLRHLLELVNLKATSYQAHTHDAFGLLQWLEGQLTRIDAAPLDTHRRRNQTSGDQIQISTIHVSKGLQYEVVFLPDLMTRADPRSDQVTYYEKDMQLAVDLSRHDFQPEDVLFAKYREHGREEMRLAYVAMTRAIQVCYLLVPATVIEPIAKAKTKVDSRLTSLLKARLAQVQQEQPASIFFANVKSAANVAQPDETQGLVAASAAVLKSKELQELPKLQSANAWKVDSFTALARRSANENHFLETVALNPLATPVTQPTAQQALDFDETVMIHFGYNLTVLPKGARTGECLHAILENTDWLQSLSSTTNMNAIERQTTRYDIARDDLQTLANWMDDVLRTPLFIESNLRGKKNFCLVDLNPKKIIREWRFDTSTSTEVTSHGQPTKSYVRGYVDLVFEHNHKFYIIDYKSNWLGDCDEYYGADALKNSMQDHQYDLQAKIYSAALKNFLAARVGAENVDAIYGGVLYLYLRAMKSHRPGQGVYFHGP
jgi:exodeoxyribonuclease V beta subunit